MSLDRRSVTHRIQAHEKRRLPFRFVDACSQALVEARLEEVRSIAVHEPAVRRPERVGEANEPRTKVPQSALIERAATAGCGDEDHATSLRSWLEDQRAAQEVAIGRIASELGDGPIADEERLTGSTPNTSVSGNSTIR